MRAHTRARRYAVAMGTTPSEGKPGGRAIARRPKGYVGIDHETIGSDILSVLQIMTLPEQTLGADVAQRLRGVKADGWYPIAWLIELMEAVDAKLGPSALPQMGRRLFKLSHAERVKQVARSARDIVHGIDGMYHHANRGSAIGGWTVLTFEPGHAELEKTTPHHCRMEEGILHEALKLVGAPANIAQPKCFRRGDDACRFVITSPITDARWTG